MPVLGGKMPMREVPCVGVPGRPCGKIILRASHFAIAKCRACRIKNGNLNDRGKRVRVRDQARKFRIVCHTLGWEPEQFEEMLAEMKRSPMCFRKKPETRVAKLDRYWQNHPRQRERYGEARRHVP